MTLLWWGRYAGTAEMEPVLPQSFSPGDVARVQGHLKGNGIPTKVEGDRVLVPADRREEAIASLAFAEILPENSASGFDEISKQLNSFMPQGTTDALFKEGKQRTLQNVIRRFPGVKDAVVLITPAGDRKMGMSNEATASIAITMKDGGQGNRKLAESAAQLVAGAQQHLPVKNASVVIGVRTYRLSNPGDGIGDSSEIGETLANHELYYEDKVHGLYPDISGLFVKVSVSLNTTSLQTQNKSFDTIQQKEKRTNSRSESEPIPGPGAAEPGALPNTGASIDQAPLAGPAGEKLVDENETEFENFAGQKMETSSKPAGDFTAVSAALRVPRSYFVKAYKAFAGSTAEPTSAALQSVMEAEIEKMRNAVVVTTAIGDVTRVAVSTYDDSPSPLLAAATAAPTGTVATSIGVYGKEIAIGALALISLFMVSMMVRKGTPAPVIAAAVAGPHETPHLDTLAEVAGIVGDTNQMLDGMELDEDAVRTQQMLDQVSTLVGENPDAAANLVKRWLNRA
jgi:flagellar biosynthesis/type III secretory pathway M-ring protein FliF/YscJ